MHDVKDAQPVKMIAGVLWARPGTWDRACEEMVARWGEIDATHDPVPFTFSDYYSQEMGPSIKRQFVSFRDLVDPGDLADFKHQANAMEARLAENARRTANIDVGYLDFHKVVLASVKPGRHRIYVGRGIWADLTLVYARGVFSPLPWTFPDLRDGTYNHFLTRARLAYRQELREAPSGSAGH